MTIYADKKDGSLTGRWCVEVTVNGKRLRGRVATVAEARAKEAEWKADLKAGKAPAARNRLDVRGVPTTLEALIRKAEGSLWAGKRTEREAFQRLWKTGRLLGLSTSLTDLTTERMDALRTALDGAAPATRNRHYSGLLSLLKWAHERKYLDTLPSFGWEDEDNGRIRWITPEEEAELMTLLPQHIAALVTVAIRTGMRRGELLGLTQRDVEPGWVRLWRTKTKTPRSVPISEETYRILRFLVDRGMPTVGELRWFWDKARAEMGLADDAWFVFHACRHTCATRMVQANVNLRIIQRFMGHKTIETTIRYAQVNDTMLTGALDQTENVFRGVQHQDLVQLGSPKRTSRNAPTPATPAVDMGRHVLIRVGEVPKTRHDTGAGVVKLADTQDLGSCGLRPFSRGYPSRGT